MITITSAEKKRIEGQMKTALPFLNNQVDFEISIEENDGNRSALVFKNDQESYVLPIFYIAPSTDDSVWEMLTEHIDDQKQNDGIFIIKFNSDNHMIQNASTYVINKYELYENKVLSEMSRLCSYINLDPYMTQLFDVEQVKKVLENLSNQKNVTETTVAEENEVKVTEPAAQKEMTETVNAVPEETVQKEVKPEPVVAKKVEEKPAQVKPSITKPVTSKSAPKVEEDKKLDSDIQALINDCFGLF